MTDAPLPPKDDQPTPPAGSTPPPGSYGNPGQQPYGGAPQQPYGGPAGYTPQPMRPEDEKLWATLVHIGGIPFPTLAALVGYLVLRDRGPFVREHTRVALNFQLTMLIGYIAGGVLSVIGIGVLLILAAGVLIFIFSIMAALAANRGQYYKYPLSIEFIKS